MMSPSSRDPRGTSPGLAEALRLLRLERRRPSDDDRPRVTPLAGPKVRPLRGQLNLLEGNEAA